MSHQPDCRFSDGRATDDATQSIQKPEAEPIASLDNPPDSFWVEESDELDWWDRNAFIERKGSVKASISRNFGPKLKPSSQRSMSFAHKPKILVIGAPKSHKKPAKAGCKAHRTCNPADHRFIRSMSEPGRDHRNAHGSEPGSPMVSCTGVVGSKRRRRKQKGFWATVRSAFKGRAKRGV